jgi:AmmeMemoRadiSam system protein A
MPENLSSDERRTLLTIARESIGAALDGRRFQPPEVTGVLCEKRGAFVTLHTRRTADLRGCIGYVEPLFPLAETISRAAVAAALNDRRFEPVAPGELGDLTIEISVLSVPKPIRPEEITVGVHGLIISQGGRSGLLLPQVATEYGWDRKTFLEHTCHKAGLSADAWHHPGAQLLAFSATVFGEESR